MNNTQRQQKTIFLTYIYMYVRRACAPALPLKVAFVVLFLCVGVQSASAMTLSGTLYSDQGVTAITSGKTIKVAVGTTTTSIHSTTSNGSGVWSVNLGAVSIPVSTPITIWVDGDAGTRAVLFTKASSTSNNIPSLDLYQNRVIVSHEGTSGTSTTISNMSFYDFDNDSDIQFTVATSSIVNTLTVFSNQELYIKSGKTFAPGGNVTINANASTTSETDGNFRIANSATYTAGGTTMLGGNFRASSSATFTPGRYTTTMNATTTGKVVYPLTTSMGNFSFTGEGGTFSFGSNATVTDFIIGENATVTAPSLLTIQGNYGNEGVYVHGNGAVRFGTTTLGVIRGNTATSSSFNDLSIINASAINQVNTIATSTSIDSYGGVNGNAFAIDSVRNTLYFGGYEDGDGLALYRCDLSLSCSVPENYTVPAEFTDIVEIGEIYIDEVNDVLYLAANSIYQCPLTTNCDEAIDFTVATTTGYVNELVVDPVNQVLYVGMLPGDDYVIIVRCELASGCDDGADFTAVSQLDVWNIAGLVIDPTNSVLYVGGADAATVYRCALSTGCDTDSEFELVYDIGTSNVVDMVVDNANQVLYVTDGGYLYRCDLTTSCDEATDFNSIDSPYGLNSNYLYIGIDSLHNTLYVNGDGPDGIVTFFCNLDTDCDAFGDFEINDFSSSRFIIDPNTGTLYTVGGDGGDVVLCALCYIDEATTTVINNLTVSATGSLTANSVMIVGDAQVDSMGSLILLEDTFVSDDLSNSGDFTPSDLVFNGSASQQITGDYTGDSILSNVYLTGSGTKTFTGYASTTGEFVIGSGSTVVAPIGLSVRNDFTNNGIFTHNNGTLYLDFNSVASGTLSGASALNNLVVATGTKYAVRTATSTGGQEIPAMVVDSTNKVLYAGMYTGASRSLLLRCDLITDCDSATDYTVATSTTGIIESLTVDTGSSTLYMGGSTGRIFRCSLSTGCDSGSDFTTATRTSESIVSLIVDPVNNVLYAGSYSKGILFRCAIGTGCDSATDFTVAYDTPFSEIDSLAVDTGSSTLYVAGGYTAGIYRCPLSTNCDASSDFTSVYGSGANYIVSLSIDTTNRTLYAIQDASLGEIYRCPLSTGCDTPSEFATVTIPFDSVYQLSLFLSDSDIDEANGFLYINGDYGLTNEGVVFRCLLSTGCDASDEFVVVATSTEALSPLPELDAMVVDPVYGGLYTTRSSGENIYKIAPTTFAANASTTNLTINTGATLLSKNSLSVSGAYTNNGRSISGATTTFIGTSAQVLSGTMTGYSTFNNVAFSGAGTKTFGSRASTTNFIIESGSAVTAPPLLTIGGNFRNSGAFTAGATTTFSSSTAQGISGTLTAANGFNTVVLAGTSTKTFGGNASTTNFVVNSGATAVLPSLFSISGNYTNNGTTTAGSGTTTFNGTSIQTATGTMTGTSAFYNLAITNTSGAGSTTQSVIFGRPASTTGTFSMIASTSAQFLANSSSTFQNINLRGASGQYVWLRSSVPGTSYSFYVPGTQEVITYVDVRDNSACPASITATDGTNVNSGNNSCWTFASGGVAGSLTLSGTLYSDEGVSVVTSAKTLNIAVGTTTTSVSATSTRADGTWSFNFTSAGIATSTPITMWIDGDATFRAALFTKASSTNSITGLDLYQNRVIVSHEGTSGTSTTLSDMSFYDFDDDSDIQYEVLPSGEMMNGLSIDYALTVLSGNELHIKTGKTFAPGGPVTLNAHASTTLPQDGSLHIADSATYTAGGITTIGGNWSASSSATFNHGSSTLVFTATTTDKVLNNASLSDYGNLVFNGAGGAWSFVESAATTSNFVIQRGDVTVPEELVVGGTFSNHDTLDHNNGGVHMRSVTDEVLRFVSGYDSSGSATGTLGPLVYSYAIKGNYLYVGKQSDTTACDPAPGSADGCELVVFDISSSTNPVFAYGSGRDSSGSATGTLGPLIDSLAIKGNYLYVGKGQDTTACGEAVGSADGCELIVFDISSSTNPVFMHGSGRDSSGSATGNLGPSIFSVVVKGNYLYVGKDVDTTACNPAVGSADGCELIVFDISSSTNPVFMHGSGRDSSGSATGTLGPEIQSLAIKGNYLYVGKLADSTACGEAVGSADGCELVVFDISSSTNPVFMHGSGRDSSGSATATSGPSVYTLAIKDKYLYMGKGQDTTTCVQTSGSAQGCELIVFDISSSTDPVFVGGRDSDGSTTTINGGQIVNAVVVKDNYLYMAKGQDTTACAQTPGLADGCELMVYDVGPVPKGRITGSLTGSNALNNVVVSLGNVQFIDNATTTDLTIYSGATITPPELLSVTGDYDNNGTLTANENTIHFDGSSAQTIDGILTGSSAFSDLNFRGDSTKLFNTNASTTGDVVVESGSTVSISTALSLGGNFESYGTINNSGTLYFTELGTNATGTLTGVGSLGNVSIEPTSDLFTVATDTAESYVQGLVIDPLNQVLYAGTADEGLILRCVLSTDCDDTTDFTLATNTGTGVIHGMIVDPVNQVLYAGSGSVGWIFRCALSTGCDSATDFTLPFATTSASIATIRAFTIDTTNQVLYVGTGSGGIILRCELSTGCDATSEFTIAADTTTTIVYNLSFDATNGVLYLGTGGTGIVLRCTVSTNCDALSDFTTATDTPESTMYSTLVDSVNDVLYVGSGSNGRLFRCVLSTGCDSAGDFLVVLYGAPQIMRSLVIDTTNNILYVGSQTNGYLYRCKLSSQCDEESDFTSNGDTGEASIYNMVFNPEDNTVYAVAGDTNGYIFRRSGEFTFGANASTSDLTIGTSSTLVAPSQLTIGGNYINSGTFTNNGGTVTFSSSTGASIYTGTSYTTTGSGNAVPVGVVYAGGYFYIIDNTDGYVYKYTETGTFTGTSFPVQASPLGLTYANGFFWVLVSGDDRMYKYSATGTYTGISFDTSGSGNGNPGGAVFAENYFWVTDAADAGVYKYTATGTFTGVAFDTSGSGSLSPTGIVYVNGYFYIVDDSQDEVFVYTTDGVYTGVSFDTAGNGNGSPGGITYANGALWVTDFVDGVVYKYTLAQTLSGTLTASSTFNNLVFSGATPKAFANNASSTHLTIATTSGEVSMPQSMTIAGNYINSTTTGFRSNDGTVYFASSSAQTLAGVMIGSSAFATTSFLGAGTKTFSHNASTTSFVASSSSGAIIAPPHLTVMGNFTNSSTFTAGSGTTTLGGYATQTLSGTMIGSSAFNNLQITNTSGAGSSSQSVLFLASASTTDTFSMIASTSVQFLAGATSTFQNIKLTGASGQKVYLRSSAPGTQYGFYVPGTQKDVSYVDVRDSSACPTLILATNGTNVDSGNTTCWSFAAAVATIASNADQVFAYLQATTTINPITITEDASSASIAAIDDIRIIIATSTTNMRWDTTDITPTFGGTASGKVSGTVSYAGDGAILIIDVTSDFSPSDTLTISDLSYARFETVSPTAVALGVRTSGVGSTTDNSDSKTVTITGTLGIGSHTSGQIDNVLTSRAVDNGELLAFKLTPSGESFTITDLAFPLKGIQGITTGELTDVYLYRDMNGDQTYDAGDVAVGGAGSVSINSQLGTITFSESFQSTTTQDYLLIGDVAEVMTTDAFVFALGSANLTSTGATSLTEVIESGEIGDLQHIKGGPGAGGGGSSIGGDAPAGDGIRTGGDEGGGSDIDPNSGDTIGHEVGFAAPTSNTGSWTTGGNGYTSDGAYATANSSVSHMYGTFGFSVPSNNQITGIVVKLEASASSEAGTISVRLSWDGGTSGTSFATTDTLTATDAVYELGSPSDTWGHSWSASEFNNGNFTVEVVANPSSNTVRIDAIQVRVYHQATGGGGGGGGAVFKEPDRFFANVYSAVGDMWEESIRSFLNWLRFE